MQPERSVHVAFRIVGRSAQGGRGRAVRRKSVAWQPGLVLVRACKDSTFLLSSSANTSQPQTEVDARELGGVLGEILLLWLQRVHLLVEGREVDQEHQPEGSADPAHVKPSVVHGTSGPFPGGVRSSLLTPTVSLVLARVLLLFQTSPSQQPGDRDPSPNRSRTLE
jgi:hypothetical protein